MSRENHLWLKLAEEATEVAHMAMKVQQFGPLQRHPKEEENNILRLGRELLDMVAVAQMLKSEFEYDLVDQFSDGEVQDHLLYKKSKVNKYYQLSKELGRG